ncbi:hypothetical protein ACJX0J_028353, partial [Zea mays]
GETPGRRRQAPHLYAVRAPDHPREVHPALLARGFLPPIVLAQIYSMLRKMACATRVLKEITTLLAAIPIIGYACILDIGRGARYWSTRSPSPPRVWTACDGWFTIVVFDHAKWVVSSSLGSFSSNGLTISSKLPRFSDMYTLTIASVDPYQLIPLSTLGF